METKGAQYILSTKLLTQEISRCFILWSREMQRTKHQTILGSYTSESGELANASINPRPKTWDVCSRSEFICLMDAFISRHSVRGSATSSSGMRHRLWETRDVDRSGISMLRTRTPGWTLRSDDICSSGIPKAPPRCFFHSATYSLDG